MKLKLIVLSCVVALGFAGVANAGSVVDLDSDLVPDAFDNCVNGGNPSPAGISKANGPGDASNQTDTDVDGYGNICDPDWDNSGGVDGIDFGLFVGAFNTADANIDVTGDGNVDGIDFGVFVAYFNDVPGPSGLACAGTIPCTP